MFFDEDVELVECNSFKEIPNFIEIGVADFGVMAIENSIAGSLLQNYKLLGREGQTIIGEIYIPIEHNLFTYGDTKIEDLEEVHSHPMAILQCEKFFNNYPNIKLVESTDTANSAKLVSLNKDKKTGAIASCIAGDIFGLTPINKSIQTIKHNYTRFFILGKSNNNSLVRKPIESNKDSKVNKASIKMSVGHKTGSLSSILSVFSMHGINLTKIQSIPIIDKPWQYSFYVDLVFPTLSTFNSAIEVINHQVKDIEILGVYKEWKLDSSIREITNYNKQNNK